MHLDKHIPDAAFDHARLGSTLGQQPRQSPVDLRSEWQIERAEPLLEDLGRPHQLTWEQMGKLAFWAVIVASLLAFFIDPAGATDALLSTVRGHVR